MKNLILACKTQHLGDFSIKKQENLHFFNHFPQIV